MNPNQKTSNPSGWRKKTPHFLFAAVLMFAAILIIVFHPGRRGSNPAPTIRPDAPSPASLDIVESNVPETQFAAIPPKNETVISNQAAAAVESLDALIAILNDSTQPLKARIKAARALIANGSDEAIAALKGTLKTGPAPLRAAIAEDLGSCPHPQSYWIMRELLSDPDETVAAGAVRGLAQKGGVDAANVLSQTLYDEKVPLNIRCEAALGLGTMNEPGTVSSLTHAAVSISDEAIVTQILNALGNRPFDETKGFFDNYIRAATTSSDLKVAAVEAIGNAQGDVSSFLAAFAQNPDPDLRAAAAWSLSAANATGTVSDQLMSWLQTEKDPTVRLRLYQALGNQENYNAALIEQTLQNESNLGARTAGFDLVAKILSEASSPELAAYFDGTAVPLLKTTALTALQGPDRIAAVTALRRSGTEAALAALKEIAAQSIDSRVRDAATGKPIKPVDDLGLFH